jgi:hypothetical protein
MKVEFFQTVQEMLDSESWMNTVDTTELSYDDITNVFNYAKNAHSGELVTTEFLNEAIEAVMNQFA